MLRGALAVLAALLLAGDAGAVDPVEPVDRQLDRLDRASFSPGLVEAFLGDDRPTVHRLGRAAGSRGLAAHLVSPHRPTVLAAIAAAPAAEDAWALLRPLARRAGEPDRSIASRAAVAGARIAADLDRDLLLTQEAPSDAVRDALAAWLRVALDQGRWADVRVRALEVCAGIAGALGPHAPALDWTGLAADADPEIRRAALELAPSPLPPELRTDAARRLADDPSDSVALAAGQVLCAELAGGGDIAPLLAAVGDAGLGRMRALAGDRQRSAAARFELVRCLVADDHQASRAAVAAFTRSAPRHLRRAAAALGRR